VKAEFVSRFQSAHNPRFVSAAVGGLSVVLFAAVRIVANDPTATLAVRCGNGFEACFSLYQCTRLSRYDALS
jgi:hypothetical protein